MKTTSQTMVYQTESLLILPHIGRIQTSTSEIRLAPVKMKVLVQLLENPHHLISRAELFAQVWGEQIVSDDTLTRCISDLRSDFNQINANIKWIETVPKRGYRWLLDVDAQNLQSWKEAIKASDTKLSALDQSNDNVDLQTSIATDSEKKQPLNKTTSEITPHQKQFYQRFMIQARDIISNGVLTILLSLFFMSLMAWLISFNINSTDPRLVIIPIHSSHDHLTVLAAELEDKLSARIIRNKSIQLLARSIVKEQVKSTYPFYSREFGAHWIIEGSVRQHEKHIRVSLSLIDARSAVIMHLMQSDLTSKNESIEPLLLTFMSEIEQYTSQ